MRKIVLTFGLIAGAVLSLTMLIATAFQDQIGFDRGVVVGYTSMVAAFLMVFFGVRQYRDQVGGGAITFGRAFLVGLGITLLASACYVATWQFVYFKLSPDFLQKYAAYSLEKARAAGATEAELAAERDEMLTFQERYDNPLFNAAVTFLEPLPVGLLITLVTAGVLRRTRGPGRED